MENNKESKGLYTFGIWRVKYGNEKEFVREWTKFAHWTDKNIHGPGNAFLLQDEKDSLRFISYGPWDSEESIQMWRDSNEFKRFASNVKELCSDFQPTILKVVSTSK